MREMGITLATALWLGSCAGSNGPSASICDAVCDCLFTLPTERDDCFVECVDEIAPVIEDIRPECVECLKQAACIEIDSCEPLCEMGGGEGEDDSGEEEL